MPVSWDSRPRGSFAITLVRVRTDQGLEGVAAGDSMAGFADYADLFLGHDPREIENRTVSRLLGGTGNRVRAYASTALTR